MEPRRGGMFTRRISPPPRILLFFPLSLSLSLSLLSTQSTFFSSSFLFLGDSLLFSVTIVSREHDISRRDQTAHAPWKCQKAGGFVTGRDLTANRVAPFSAGANTPKTQQAQQTNLETADWGRISLNGRLYANPNREESVPPIIGHLYD